MRPAQWYDMVLTGDWIRPSEETAQEFYGRWAGLYDLIASYTPGIARLRRRAARACRLEPGDTVVELGCGTGANLPSLREAVGPEGTVIGLDFTGPVLERARKRTATDENVHVIRADATQPPLALENADAILATFLVGMLEEPAAAVEQWCESLSPGGHLVLANAARSDAWYAPPVNAVFSAIVVCSTPPTTKLRYERDPVSRLDERIETAHEELRRQAVAVAEERHVFGVVQLTGGRIE